jgi:uncharacterized protein (DUF302 family)
VEPVVFCRMVTTVSFFGHGETVTRLLDAISQAGLTLFAQFDHAAGARDVGMDLPDELVIVFGNPRAGTLLMQADPRVGIELPLRVLVWNQDGQTIVGYNDPKDLGGTYDLTAQTTTLQAMSSLLQSLTDDATGSADRHQ